MPRDFCGSGPGVLLRAGGAGGSGVLMAKYGRGGVDRLKNGLPRGDYPIYQKRAPSARRPAI